MYTLKYIEQCLIFKALNEIIKANNGVKNGISGFFNGATVNIAFTEDEITRIKKYYEEMKNTGKTFKTIVSDSGDASKSVKLFAENVDTATMTEKEFSTVVQAGNVQIQTTGVISKAAAIGVKLLKSALFSIAAIGITLVISKIIQSIIDFSQRVEKAKEEIVQIQDKIKGLNQTLTNHKKRIDEISKSYDKLAKGVNLDTLENLSLSDEDYEEFISLNNELAEMFPNIVKNIDDQGNAILNLGNNGTIAAEGLRELLEEEERINNQKIAENLPQYLKDFKTIYNNETKKDVTKFTNESKNGNAIVEEIARLQNTNYNILDGDYYTKEIDIESSLKDVYIEAIRNAYQDIYKEADDEQKQFLQYALSEFTDDYNMTQSITVNFEYFTPEQKQSFKDSYSTYLSNLSKEMQDVVSDSQGKLEGIQREVNSTWSDFVNSLMQGMTTKATYSALDKSSQDLVKRLVENLSTDVANEMDERDPYKYIRTNIINNLDKISGEVRNSLGSLLDDAYSPDKAAQVAKEIETDLNNIGINIDLSFKYDENSLYQRVQNSFDRLTINTDDPAKYREELEQFFKDNNINTDAAYNLWLKVTFGINNATQAMAEYIKMANKPVEYENFFTNENQEKVNAYISKIKELQYYLQKLHAPEGLSEEEQTKLSFDYGISADDIDEYDDKIRQIIHATSTSESIMIDLANAISICSDEAEKSRLENLKQDLEDLTASASELSSTTLTTLQNHAKILYDVNKEIKGTKKISSSTIESIASAFPSLGDELAEYELGLIDTADLFKAMEEAYQEDEDNYKDYIASKLQCNEDFYNDVVKNISDDIKNLATGYEIDFENYKNTAEAKLDIEKKLAKKRLELESVVARSNKLNEIAVENGNAGTGLRDQAAALDAFDDVIATEAEINDLLAIIEGMNTAIDITLDLNPNFDTSWNKRGKDTSKKDKDNLTTDKFENEIDWITNSLNNLQDAVDKAQNTFDNTIGYDKQIESLTTLNEALTNLKDGYTQAGDYYTDLYDESSDDYQKLVKLVGKKKAKKYLKQIKSTDKIDIQKIVDQITYDSSNKNLTDEQKKSKGEKIYDVVSAMMSNREKAISYYKQATDTQNKIDDNNVQKKQLNLDKSNAKKDIITEKLNNRNATYNEQLKLLKDQKEALTKTHKEQIKVLKATADKTAIDKENIAYQNAIAENEDKQRKVIKEKNKDSIDFLQNAQDTLKAEMELSKSMGGIATIDQYETLIEGSKLEQQAHENGLTYLQEEQNSLKKTSDRYKEVTAEIRSTKEAITQCVKSQIEYNNAILNLPIEYLNKQKQVLEDTNTSLNQTLDKYKNAIDAVNYIIDSQSSSIQRENNSLNIMLETYNGALSAANKLIDDRIKELNQTVEDINTKYDKLLAPLEKELEALQDSNDERKNAISLQKAQYELERQQNQKTVKVFKEGVGWTFEADSDQIKQARENLDNALYEDKVYKLQKQIKELNKEKELILYGEDKHSGIQGEIEKLEQIKRGYENIASAFQDAWNLQQGLNIDADFVNKVLDGTFDPSIISNAIYDLNERLKINNDTLKSLEDYKELINRIVTDIEGKDKVNKAEDFLGIASLERFISTNGLDVYEKIRDGYSNIYEAIADNDEALLEINKDITALETFMHSLDGTQTGFEKCFTNIISYLKENNPDLLEQLGFDDEQINKLIQSSKELDETSKEKGESIVTMVDENTQKVTDSFDQMNTDIKDKELTFESIMDDYVKSSESAANRISNALGEINSLIGQIDSEVAHAEDSKSKVSSTNKSNDSKKNTTKTTTKTKTTTTKQSSNTKKEKVTKKHSGMKTGFVDNKDTTLPFKKRFEELCLTPLKPDEIPIVALKGEAVLTNEQQKLMVDNYQKALLKPNLVHMNPMLQGNSTTITIGDINLHEVKNVNELAHSIKTQLPQAILQELYK